MKKVKVDENYIAGFFDGEGHFDKKRGTIVLTNKVKPVLDAIQKKLKELDIKSSIKETSFTRKGRVFSVYRLFIYGALNCNKFIKKIGCLIPAKKKLFEEYYNKYIKKERKAHLIKKLRQVGNSYRDIERLTGFPSTTCWRVCTR